MWPLVTRGQACFQEEEKTSELSYGGKIEFSQADLASSLFQREGISFTMWQKPELK